ncbi:p60 domain-containing protein [Hortaea werneckii]|nr:p60 domain-containing protein [Hortaea werneckii]
MANNTTVAASPATYAQPSRKGKKAWRKNVDISHITSGLDDVRNEIIQGGVVSEKDADQLFATDLTGDADIERKQKSKKPLKADEILAQRSAVPGLEPSRKKRKATADEGVPGVAKKSKNGKYVPHKDLQRLRNAADQTGGVAVEEEQADHDPWAPVPKKQDPRLNYLEDKPPPKEPATKKMNPVAHTASGKHVPNVRKPEAGKSYNPLVTDWTALLEREGAKAVEDEKARLAAEAAIAEQEARAQAEAAKVEAQEKDAEATDYESAWESEWEGFQSGGEDNQQVHTAKTQRRKTPAERNKVKARKEREAREKWEKKQKERDAQANRIGQIAREVSGKDQARLLANKQKKKHHQSHPLPPEESSADESDDSESVDPQLQRRRFGQLPIPDAPLEVVLPDELQDSLRRLKPEGDLMADRYRNLLVNGKLEVRRKRDKEQWAKPKRETTEKWSYKDWALK